MSKVDKMAREAARKAFWDGLPGVCGADECLDEAIAAYEAAKPDKPCPYVVTSDEGTSFCQLAAGVTHD